MKYYKQRINECALCSLCMLTGTDYETASDLFEVEYGVRWGVEPQIGRKQREEFVKKVWGLTKTEGLIWVSIFANATGDPRPKPPYALAVTFGGGQWSHSVVVQADGKVYDPGTKLLHKDETSFLKHSAKRTGLSCEVSGRLKIGE